MASMPEDRNNPFREIEIDKLDLWADANVRKQDITAGVEDLAENMKEIGQQQPIVVQEKDGRYLILIGQRRYLAAKSLRWRTLWARVVSGLSPLEAKIRSLSENMLRERLTPSDQAEATKFLFDQLHSVRAVAERLGVSDLTVRNWLSYYNIVPEPIKKMVDNNLISIRQARRLAEHVPDEKRAIAIAEEMAKEGRPRQEKANILLAAEQYPDLPPDVIIGRSERFKNIKRINFILPPEWDQVLNVASKNLDKDRNDVARDATIEWLRESRYKG